MKNTVLFLGIFKYYYYSEFTLCEKMAKQVNAVLTSYAKKIRFLFLIAVLSYTVWKEGTFQVKRKDEVLSSPGIHHCGGGVMCSDFSTLLPYVGTESR